MADIVHYILGDLFRFAGAVIIVALVFDGLASIVVAIRGDRPNSILSRIFGQSENTDQCARLRDS